MHHNHLPVMCENNKLLLLFCNNYTVIAVLSETPTSRNVSEGVVVEFTCGTLLGDVTLVWKPVTLNNHHTSARPGGGKLSTLRFTATATWNNTQVTCTALNSSFSSLESSSAALLVQGKWIIQHVPVHYYQWHIV